MFDINKVNWETYKPTTFVKGDNLKEIATGSICVCLDVKTIEELGMAEEDIPSYYKMILVTHIPSSNLDNSSWTYPEFFEFHSKSRNKENSDSEISRSLMEQYRRLREEINNTEITGPMERTVIALRRMPSETSSQYTIRQYEALIHMCEEYLNNIHEDNEEAGIGDGVPTEPQAETPPISNPDQIHIINTRRVTFDDWMAAFNHI